MKRRVVTIAAALLAVVGLAVVAAQNVPRGKLSGQTSPLNETIEGTVPVVGPDAGAVSFPLYVTDDIYELTIRIANAPADLDILLYDRSGDLVAYSELFEFNETMTLSRIGELPLETGFYDVEVVYQLRRPPEVEGEQLTEIPFDLTFDAVIPQPLRTLRPGDSVSGTLTPEAAMIDMYRIDVPTGVATLRLDISGTTADLDLTLTRDAPPTDPFQADVLAQSVRSTETLTLDRTDARPLRPGTYYVTVFDQLDNTYPTDYTLHVHGGAGVAAELAGTGAMERMLTAAHARSAGAGDSLAQRLPVAATVEVLTVGGGGSGVLVSPDGLILTNYHVVTAASGAIADDLVVAMTADAAEPPQEVFRAQVIEHAEERDLALLRITGGRYGQSLPDGAEFPYVEVRREGLPDLGSDLHVLGYPTVGGTGSRASITYTRGVVSGFQRVPFGTLIKTDGEINSGNSGGAALDNDMRLVGMPTEVVGRDAGQIAYIYPVSAIPASWMRLIAP